MKPYFDRTPLDEAFYREHIAPRLPESIFDAHIHCNLPEHVAMVPEARWYSDWALECGHVLPCEDAQACAKALYPDARYEFAALPLAIREADMHGNNAYLAEMGKAGRLTPFMAVRPEWSPEEVERTLLEGGFVGFKPYPDMVSGVKGAEISIFAFMPPAQWEIANRHKKVVVLHLPRKGRLPDDDNIREIRHARETYPDVTIVIAHFGRSFCPVFLEEGLDKLDGVDGLYFDTAAVINPAVFDVAFARIPRSHILFGSDMPILFWHGKREWTERAYHNLCREDFTWNTDRRSPEEEATYTLFLYEQMRALLDACDRHRLSAEEKRNLFGGNARRMLGIE